MTGYNLFYYPYASFTNQQLPLLKVAALLAATEDDPPELTEQTEALLAEQARAPLLLPPLSARLSATEGVRGPRCAAFSGTSLHANLAVPSNAS